MMQVRIASRHMIDGPSCEKTLSRRQRTHFVTYSHHTFNLKEMREKIETAKTITHKRTKWHGNVHIGSDYTVLNSKSAQKRINKLRL